MDHDYDPGEGPHHHRLNPFGAPLLAATMGELGFWVCVIGAFGVPLASVWAICTIAGKVAARRRRPLRSRAFLAALVITSRNRVPSTRSISRIWSSVRSCRPPWPTRWLGLAAARLSSRTAAP
jgi:hypothetical protein